MSVTSVQGSLLRLSDIGVLANVRRPVVTTWRARHAERHHPFPAPARVVDGQELFEVDQVVAWLEITGCGNNPQARQDAVAFTLAAADIATDPEVFAALTALICLRASTGPLPADLDDLLDAADRFDSDDDILFSEVERLGPRLEPLARYAELLVANAVDPADPLDDLIRRQQQATTYRPVHAELRRLVARTAVALADEAGFDKPTYVVRRVPDLDLVIAGEDQTERRGSLRVALALSADQWHSPQARLAQRWLRVHDVGLDKVVMDTDGSYELPDQAIVLLRLPTNGSDRLTDLEEVTNLCLNSSPRTRAVIVGPAHSLTDALLSNRPPGRPTADVTELSPAGLSRSDALRTSAVRSVVRLPAGLLTEQSRSRAALWCLGPSRSMPPVTLCADLTQSLHAASADDLVTDLMAAMRGPQTEAAHESSSARFRSTSDLSVSVGDLVAPTVRAAHLGPAAVATNVLDALTRAARGVPGIVQPEITVLEGGSTLPRTTLDDAVVQRKVAMLPGARVESSTGHHVDGVPVVRHPADLGRRPELPSLSVITLATAYPRVVLTEPGDVVVTTVGGPAAAVDALGGLVVAYPARVLRCHRPLPSTPQDDAKRKARGVYPPEFAPQSFTPESVAADINALPTTATRWRAWPLTVLPADQIPNVERVLTELAERRARLDAARADIDTTIRALTQAVGAQVCSVGPTGPAHTEERTTA